KPRLRVHAEAAAFPRGDHEADRVTLAQPALTLDLGPDFRGDRQAILRVDRVLEGAGEDHMDAPASRTPSLAHFATFRNTLPHQTSIFLPVRRWRTSVP